MHWKPAHLVYEGGTEELRTFYGKRLRVRRHFQAFERLAEGKLGAPALLESGRIGFVGHPTGLSVVLVFPKDLEAKLSSIDAMLKQRIDFFAAVVSWDEFRSKIEIQS